MSWAWIMRKLGREPQPQPHRSVIDVNIKVLDGERLAAFVALFTAAIKATETFDDEDLRNSGVIIHSEHPMKDLQDRINRVWEVLQ